MALMKRPASQEMERWFDDMFGERLFPSVFRRFPSWRRLRELEGSFPAVDMYDNEKEIVVKAEVPGIDKDTINIYLSDSRLTIKGKMKKEEEVEEDNYYYSERSYGSFSRSLDLPAKVQQDKVKAEFKDGILEIHLPKVKEAKPKEIKVDVK